LAPATQQMCVELTVEHFSPHIGQHFALGSGGQGLTLELSSAQALGVGPAHGRRSFALLFNGDASAPLAQGTYPLVHPELGVLDIFLVPVGSGPHGRLYEAIFN